MRDFLDHVPARHQLRDRPTRHAARLRLVPREKDSRRSSTATCAWASRTSSPPSTRLPHHLVVSRAEADADRDRRVGPGWLRGVPGPAARLSQHDDVFELHGGELRADARSRRPARRQPRRRADVGVRVRGPAVLRRFPRTGQQRHRSACAQRVSDAQPDGRRADRRDERRLRYRSTPSSLRRSAIARTSPRSPAAKAAGSRSWSGTTTTTTCRGRRPRCT